MELSRKAGTSLKTLWWAPSVPGTQSLKGLAWLLHHGRRCQGAWASLTAIVLSPAGETRSTAPLSPESLTHCSLPLCSPWRIYFRHGCSGWPKARATTALWWPWSVHSKIRSQLDDRLLVGSLIAGAEYLVLEASPWSHSCSYLACLNLISSSISENNNIVFITLL